MKGYEDLVKLLQHVQATHGFDTDEKTVCDYQDMIGHSSEEQLTELANGAYKESFYRIYGCAYGTIEAIKFFTKHGEKILAMLSENADLKCDLEIAEDNAKKNFDLAEKNRQSWIEEKNRANNAENQITEKEKEIASLQDEIIRLKARLYDLIEK